MSDATSASLAIIVVAYNSAGYLPDLLSSVERHCADSIVVVVNNSADAETRSACELSALDVRYIEPESNLGYAAAIRLGSSVAATDVVLVLNPDVTLTVDPRSLVAESSIEIVTGVLVRPGRSWSVGQIPENLHPLPTVGRELLRSVVSYRAYRWRRPLSTPTTVPQADGAWLLGRRSVWERLGWMDERYELYYEDVALCRALAPTGSLLALPRVVGEHRGGSSASSAGGLAYKLLGVSRVRYYHLTSLGASPRLLGVVTSLTEFAIRSVARRPEGQAIRWQTLRLQLREARQPGSVWLLGGARDMSAAPGRRD